MLVFSLLLLGWLNLTNIASYLIQFLHITNIILHILIICLVCFTSDDLNINIFFFSSRRRHTRFSRDWSSDCALPISEDLAGCDLVIEAVFEDPGLKNKVFAEIASVVEPDALLCSNTSTLPITGLADGVDRPEDFVGMHFFSPVDKMPLVELIVGRKTSDEALAKAYDVVRQIRKTPIVVNDSRGFFTSRVFGTLVMEGIAMVAEGINPVTVERAATQTGFPAPPLAMVDEVTLTLPLKIRDAARAAGESGGAFDD